MRVYIVLLFFVAFIAQGKAEGESKDLCPEGWIQLTDTCGLDGEDVCVKVGQPLKFVSWLHLQFMCDAAGGYLPELTAANKGELDLILSSYDQLYGATLLYLGATDITHTDDWKWLNSRKPLENENWGKDLQSKSNKDCLAQSSETKLWENIDCEDQNIQTQVAFVCMRKKSNGNVAGLVASETPSVTPSCTNPKVLDMRKTQTCTASSQFNKKSRIEKAFDSEAKCGVSDFWLSDEDARVGAWIQADFGKSVTITSVKIMQIHEVEWAAKKITISFDNNVQRTAELNTDCEKGWNEISLTDPVESETMKIMFNDFHDENAYTALLEVQIYGCG